MKVRRERVVAVTSRSSAMGTHHTAGKVQNYSVELSEALCLLALEDRGPVDAVGMRR